jgi:hypothetical protein
VTLRPICLARHLEALQEIAATAGTNGDAVSVS